MTRPGALLLVVVLDACGACRRDAPRQSASAIFEAASPSAAATATTATATATTATAATRARHVQRRATFRTSSVQLSIEDVGMSTRFDDVLAHRSARLVVNGGFFDPKGGALGLAVSEGKTLSAYAPSMSGGVLWARDGVAHLSATEEYEAGAVDFAIQCRPRLVVGSRSNIRSDDGRRARRTAICLRDGGQTLEVLVAGSAITVASDVGPTLFELAEELVADGCEEALNLDGGPSTGWASRESDGGVVFEAPQGAVRHVVVVQSGSR